MPDRERALDQLISDIATDLFKLQTLYTNKKKTVLPQRTMRMAFFIPAIESWDL